jgi:hypothetical protein
MCVYLQVVHVIHRHGESNQREYELRGWFYTFQFVVSRVRRHTSVTRGLSSGHLLHGFNLKRKENSRGGKVEVEGPSGMPHSQAEDNVALSILIYDASTRLSNLILQARTSLQVGCIKGLDAHIGHHSTLQ